MGLGIEGLGFGAWGLGVTLLWSRFQTRSHAPIALGHKLEQRGEMWAT